VVDDSSRHALYDTFEAPFKTALIRRLSAAWQLGWVYLWPRFAAKALLLPRYGSKRGVDGLNGRRMYRKLYGKQRGFAYGFRSQTRASWFDSADGDGFGIAIKPDENTIAFAWSTKSKLVA
jgi:hypothetical protein